MCELLISSTCTLCIGSAHFICLLSIQSLVFINFTCFCWLYVPCLIKLCSGVVSEALSCTLLCSFACALFLWNDVNAFKAAHLSCIVLQYIADMVSQSIHLFPILWSFTHSLVVSTHFIHLLLILLWSIRGSYAHHIHSSPCKVLF